MPMPKKPRQRCLVCGKEPARAAYTYCSNVCQATYRYLSYVKDWRDGKKNGLQGMGIVSRHVKRYLRGKFGNKCCICGWGKVNNHTKAKIIPLVADHIDGDRRNNTEHNLRLICPNCDSLTPTYAGLNIGNGRKGRVLSNRAKEGRVFVAHRPD